MQEIDIELSKSNVARDKPFFLAACAIIKDEADYILEWIAFHRVVGFEYFYIYDNESSDGVGSLLAPLEAHGICTRTPWPRAQEPDAPQTRAYRHAMASIGNQTTWLATIDADEFVVPLHKESVSDVLKTSFSHADSVLCNWKMFGSAGLQAFDHRLCIERFVRCAPSTFSSNNNVKSIARPDAVELAVIHNHYLKTGAPILSDGTVMAPARSQLTEVPVHGELQINHYYCKSKDEFARKRLKGIPDRALNDPTIIRPWAMFDHADVNDVEDLSAIRFIDQTKREIEKLRQIIQHDKDNVRFR